MYEKEKKFFPKITDPQCQLKWNWSSLLLNEGTTNSCHRCLRVPLDLENFDDFHNLPHKIKERKIMLSGKWPTVENGGSGHCNHCKKVEDLGGKSDRMNMFEIPNQYPPELESDPSATHVTPRILEILLNDTCNMKCVYCGPEHSSQWKNEIKKHGAMTDQDGMPMRGLTPTSSGMYKSKDQKVYLSKTKDWLIRNAHKLTRLHLQGGETFYQSELDDILEALEKQEARHLELNIISNLMVKEEQFTSRIEHIKKLCADRKIGRFDLTASIDGWGPEAEYARTGLKCDHFEKLFSYVVDQKWMTLHVNLTVTSLTVRSIPQLVTKLLEYRKKNPKISIRAGALASSSTPPLLHPSVFGRNFWMGSHPKNSSYLQNILSVWPKMYHHDVLQMQELESIFQTIPSEMPDKKLLGYFKHFLDQLDKRRNTNWRTVFPYLDI